MKEVAVNTNAALDLTKSTFSGPAGTGWADRTRLLRDRALREGLMAAGAEEISRGLAARMGRLLKDLGGSESEQAQMADALLLMREIHEGQKRVDGIPYVHHTLLVAVSLLGKFHLQRSTQANARGASLVDMLTAACLHDAVEDQSERILAAHDIAPSGQEQHDKEAALQCLGQHFADRHGTQEVTHLLSALTNPDFNAMIDELKSNKDSALRAQAEHLLALAERSICPVRPASSALLARLRDQETGAAQAVKNALYLGHFIQIRETQPDAFIIKLSDFMGNGLHHHLLRRQIEDLPLGSSERSKVEEKANKLRAKYAPVVLYLDRLFEEGCSQPITGSPQGDAWYRRKLDFVRHYAYAPRPAHEPQRSIEHLAARLHELWRAGRMQIQPDESIRYEPRPKEIAGLIYDIANLSYWDLPEKFREENRKAAGAALAAIPAVIEILSDHVHADWMHRNNSWAPQDLMVPFNQLPEHEQEKDRNIAIEALRHWARQG